MHHVSTTDFDHARQSRPLTLSHSRTGLTGALQPARGWLGDTLRRWRRRKMIASLKSLDDRMLADIGLCRGDIEDTVDGFSDRELRMAPVSAAHVRREAGCDTRAPRTKHWSSLRWIGW